MPGPLAFVAVALAGLSCSAGAQEWTGAVDSNWFNAGNWINPSAVPAAGSQAIVNQAPPVLASALAPGAAPIVIGSLVIGGSVLAPFGPGRSGQLTIQGLALTSDFISVGTLFGTDAALAASGTFNSDADVTARFGLTVGALGSDVAGASGSGQMGIGGNLTGDGSATIASLSVGSAFTSVATSSGSANGLLTVGGNLGGYASINAGTAFQTATGAAGTLGAAGQVAVNGDVQLDAAPGFRTSLVAGLYFTQPPNAGSGLASGTVTVGGALQSAKPLDIVVGEALGPGNAIGSVSANALSVPSVGTLIVGVAAGNFSTTPTSATANGSVLLGPGDVVLDSSNFGVFIGRADGSSNGSATATGTLVAAGQLDAAASGLPLLQVGAASASGAGAVASANGSAQLGGVTGVSSLQIGTASAAGTGATASATGVLQLGAGGLAGLAMSPQNNFALVGFTNAASEGVATANGLLTISGGSMTQFGSLSIGAGRNATGRVEIAGGDLLMTDSIAGGFLSTILVGISGGDGALRVSDGDVSAGAIVVGANFGPVSPTVPTAGVAEFVRSTVDVGTADAETSFSTVGFEGRGELRLVDSTMNVHGSVGVGSGFFDPAQEGLLELTRSILGIDGGLFLGEFSRLLFDIEGLARGSEYGAIDTGTGTLNGVLDIRFAFTPAPGTHVFDLIVADTASGGVFGSAGLAGVFDSVILSGLGAGFGFAVEYVPFASDPALTQIVRLTIAVPEPAPWALVLLAALALTFVLRRRRAGARAV